MRCQSIDVPACRDRLGDGLAASPWSAAGAVRRVGGVRRAAVGVGAASVAARSTAPATRRRVDDGTVDVRATRRVGADAVGRRARGGDQEEGAGGR